MVRGSCHPARRPEGIDTEHDRAAEVGADQHRSTLASVTRRRARHQSATSRNGALSTALSAPTWNVVTSRLRIATSGIGELADRGAEDAVSSRRSQSLRKFVRYATAKGAVGLGHCGSLPNKPITQPINSCSSTWATPSSSLEAVTIVGDGEDVGVGVGDGDGVPAQASIGRSLGMSPNATTSAGWDTALGAQPRQGQRLARHPRH